MKTRVTETSIDAYHSLPLGMVSTSCQKIEDWVAANGNSTIGEIAKGLQMEKSSVSARRNELIAANRVCLGGRRACRISGRTVETVFISPKQNNLFPH